MAFVSSALPQEQQNQFAANGVTTPNPLSMLPPQAGGSAGSGTGGGSPAQATPTQFGSDASKLSDYLSANADQVAGMGAGIAGELSGGFNEAQGAVNTALQGFTGEVGKSYTPLDQSALDNMQANPADFAGKPENVSKFQSMYNDTYNGPQNFETTGPYAQVQNQVQHAVDNASLVNSYPGMSTYLNNRAKGTYTPGMNTLDTVLLTGNAPAYKQVTDAAKPYTGLGQYLSSSTAEADKAVPLAQKAAQDTSEAAHGSISKAQQTLSDNVNKEYADAQSQAGNYNTNVSRLRGAAGNVNSALTDYLAAHPQITQQLDSLAPWVNLQPINSPDIGSVAKQGDYANLAALNMLSGSNLNAPISMDSAGKAGTFALPQDLQAALQGGAVPKAMNAELTGIANQIKGAYAPYQDLMQREMTRSDLVHQADALTTQMAQLQKKAPPPYLLDSTTGQPSPNPAFKEYQDQMASLQGQLDPIRSNANYDTNNYWGQIAQMGQGLQWLPGAANDYNTLTDRLGSELGGLQGLDIPNVNVGDNSLDHAEDAAARAGMFFPTLGASAILPASVINSMTHGIQSGLDSIGDFFGGLF